MLAGEKQIAEGVDHPAVLESSGLLPRVMGVFAVFLFSVGGISLAYSGGLPISTIAGMYPGSNLLLVLVAMLVVSLVFSYLYSVIGAVAPHQGADYILSSRIISPPLAFASSWTMVVLFSVASGAIIASISQQTAPLFLQSLIRLTGSAHLQAAEAWLHTPYATVLVGTGGVLIVFLLLIFPPRITHRVLLGGAILTLISWSIICWQLSTHRADDFAAGFDSALGPMAYLEHLLQAKQMGMPLDFRPETAIFAGLLMSLWVFYGFQNVVSFSGEITTPGRSLLLGMVSGLLACFGLLAVAVFFLQRAVPFQWIAAESFLYLHAPGSNAMPWLPFYGALLFPSPLLLWFIGAAWIVSVLNMAHVFLFASSRVIVAWSKDDLFPRLAGFVHPALNSPVVAVLIVCTLAEVGIVDAALNQSVLQRFNPLVFIIMAMILPVLSIAILPFARPALFAAAPRFARWYIGPVPGVTLLGGLAVLYLLYVIAANAVLQIFGGIDRSSLLLFAAAFGFGLLLYYARRAGLRDQSRSLDAELRRFPQN